MGEKGLHVYLIIPLTPESMKDGNRERMQQMLLLNLNEIDDAHITPIFIGEDPISENGIFIQQEKTDKGSKVIQALSYLNQEGVADNDWVVRLDDDDIININILNKLLKEEKVDAVVDLFHHFGLDGTNYRASSIRRWFPNTMAHRFKHAVAVIEGTFLLAHDHSLVWHSFYKDKNVKFLSKKEPFYIRRISNNSETAITSKGSHSDYLHSFGWWKIVNDNWSTYFANTSQNEILVGLSIFAKIRLIFKERFKRNWFK